MTEKRIRDESTAENKETWKRVEEAAKHAPEWVVERLKTSSDVVPAGQTKKK